MYSQIRQHIICPFGGGEGIRSKGNNKFNIEKIDIRSYYKYRSSLTGIANYYCWLPLQTFKKTSISSEVVTKQLAGSRISQLPNQLPIMFIPT